MEQKNGRVVQKERRRDDALEGAVGRVSEQATGEKETKKMGLRRRDL